MSSVLKLQGVPIGAIPDIKEALKAAKSLIEGIPSWSRGLSYHGVQTHKLSDGPGPAWHSRTSLHKRGDGVFDEFWACLGVNHTLHEKEYVPEVQTSNLLGTFGGFEGWALGYKFLPPLSNRVFTILIACVLEESPIRQGFVISLPFDVSHDESLVAKEPHGVRGYYVSVERVRELDDQVEWIMATRSSPGGLIPTFLSELAMPSKICEDVPHVVDWLQAKRQAGS